MWGDLALKKTQLFAQIKKFKAAKNAYSQRSLNSQENKEHGCFCRHYRHRHWRKPHFYFALALLLYRPLCYEHPLHPGNRPRAIKKELKMGSQTACLLCCHRATIHRQNHMKTIAHRPYIPELAPADFFLILEMKNGAGWQGSGPGRLQKQLGWGQQEADQRRLRHRLQEGHRTLKKVHLPRGQIYEEKLKNTLV